MRQLLSSVLTLRTNVILHHLNVSEHPQQDLLKIHYGGGETVSLDHSIMHMDHERSCTSSLDTILPHTRSFLIFNKIQANSPAQGPCI
jgi:hypothetical protein